MRPRSFSVEGESRSWFKVNIAGMMKMIVVMVTLILSITAPVIKMIAFLLQKRRDRLFYLSNSHIKDTL